MTFMFATERKLRCKANLARDIAASCSDPLGRHAHLQLARRIERQLRDGFESYLLAG